jgi:hypothetical protein
MKFEISEAEDGVQALDICRVGLPTWCSWI